MFWCDKVTGLSQNIWLRAIGWYSMALLDTLDKVDNSDHKYDKECRMLQDAYVDLMNAMIRYQDESGMWYQVVNFGGMERNYLETSGSSIMAYSLLKGVRLGFLPESYRAYGEKAIDGICKRYLKEKNGEMSLGGICLVAGLGGKDNRPGTYDYYMSDYYVTRKISKKIRGSLTKAGFLVFSCRRAKSDIWLAIPPALKCLRNGE